MALYLSIIVIPILLVFSLLSLFFVTIDQLLEFCVVSIKPRSSITPWLNIGLFQKQQNCIILPAKLIAEYVIDGFAI
mgnify:CR=1 FL=1